MRDQLEFRAGGEACVERPAEPAGLSDAEWADYLFYRDNIRGVQTERWFHEYGCRQWFLVQRDTVSHAIHGAWPLGANPEPPSEHGP